MCAGCSQLCKQLRYTTPLVSHRHARGVQSYMRPKEAVPTEVVNTTVVPEIDLVVPADEVAEVAPTNLVSPADLVAPPLRAQPWSPMPRWSPTPLTAIDTNLVPTTDLVVTSATVADSNLAAYLCLDETSPVAAPA